MYLMQGSHNGLPTCCLNPTFYFTSIPPPTGTHWIGGWVSPREGLDAAEKKIEPPEPRSSRL
jgi:hypothetical protein